MGFCSSSIERIRDEWSSEYRVILQYLPQVTVYICFGDWDGLWVWIRRIGQPKGWSMVSNLALQGQTSCLCSMLFMKLLFTFIGFIILTFLNKGKLQFLAVFSLKIFFFFLDESDLLLLFLLCRWYKIKVTMRWEVGEDSYPGIPARVVQYEGDIYS